MTWPPESGVAGATDRILWEVLGALAEVEREMTKERYESARRDLQSRNALVGKPPFGFMVTGEKFNKTLAPDPALVPYLRGMIDRAMRGDSYRSMAQWLDSEGIPPKVGQKWSPSTVRTVLINPALMGRRYENGKVVLKFDSILSLPDFRALQAEIERRPKKRGPNDPNTAMLTGIIRCEHCGGPMYRHVSKTKRKNGTYSVYTIYRCKGPDQSPSTCANSIKLDVAEEWVNRMFNHGGPWANTELVEIRTVPGDDHADDIAEIEDELRSLDFDSPDFQTHQRDLLAERARLRELPVAPAEVVEVPTGLIVGDVWPTLSDSERRKHLLAAGVQLFVHRVDDEGGKPRHTHIFSADHEDRITGAIRLIRVE
jgi:site-specific DNA recombinase